MPDNEQSPSHVHKGSVISLWLQSTYKVPLFPMLNFKPEQREKDFASQTRQKRNGIVRENGDT